MKRKPFAAFGRILYGNFYEASEEVEINTNLDSKTVLFVTEGHAIIKNKNTGEILYDCMPGFFKKEWVNQEHKGTFPLPTVCWCYDPKVNQNYVPEIESVVIENGKSMIFPSNTNLFLCFGTLEINGKDFKGPYQIAIKTDKTKVTAKTVVYGLLFK